MSEFNTKLCTFSLLRVSKFLVEMNEMKFVRVT